MVFKTIGNKSNPVILFFHAMGVIGESSMPVAEKMKEKYYCIMPTSTVYCPGQGYQSKRDEIQQIVRFLENHGIKEIGLAVASSIGADQNHGPVLIYSNEKFILVKRKDTKENHEV